MWNRKSEFPNITHFYSLPLFSITHHPPPKIVSPFFIFHFLLLLLRPSQITAPFVFLHTLSPYCSLSKKYIDPFSLSLSLSVVVETFVSESNNFDSSVFTADFGLSIGKKFWVWFHFVFSLWTWIGFSCLWWVSVVNDLNVIAGIFIQENCWVFVFSVMGFSSFYALIIEGLLIFVMKGGNASVFGFCFLIRSFVLQDS